MSKLKESHSNDIKAGTGAELETPSEETIINTALNYRCIEQKNILPQVFGSQGRLRSGWKHMEPKIKDAKRKRDIPTSNGEIHSLPPELPVLAPTSSAIVPTLIPTTTAIPKSNGKKNQGTPHKTRSAKSTQSPKAGKALTRSASSKPFAKPSQPSQISENIDTIHVDTQQHSAIAEPQYIQKLNTLSNEQKGKKLPDLPEPSVPDSSNDQISRELSSHLEKGNVISRMHGGSQEQFSRSSSACGTCNLIDCSCEVDEEILCSDGKCYRRWWDQKYLWEHCRIRLRDAKELQRRNNGWLCPQCLHKERFIRGLRELNPSLSLHDDAQLYHAQLPIVDGDGLQEWELRDDTKLQQGLHKLTGLMQQYTAMPRHNLWPTQSQWRLLDVPDIRYETISEPHHRGSPIINIMRNLFDVPDGVLIKDMLLADAIPDTQTLCSIWVHGVLSHLVEDFVFHSGSPFEDATLVKKSLSKAHVPPESIDMIVHLPRIQTIEAYARNSQDPEVPTEFKERVEKRQQSFVEKLNTAMLPVMGGDRHTQARHVRIAKVATGLNMLVSAYKGTFESINPQKNDDFNSQDHTPAGSSVEGLESEQRRVLVCTMIGIRYKLPGKEWRTCLPARVQLQNKRQCTSETSASPTLPASSSADNADTFKPSSPAKRQYNQIS